MRDKLDINRLDLGKIPPQAIDIEEVVLGAILLEGDCFDAVSSLLHKGCFYKHSHQLIWEAVYDLNSKQLNIDILTVTEELRKKSVLDEVGGPHYITSLTSRIASSAHIIDHSRIIAQKYIQRELIRISNEVQRNAYDDSIDIDDLKDFAESEFLKLNLFIFQNEATHIKESLQQSKEEIIKAHNSDEKLIGLTSGLSKLDRLTNGWQKSDLILVAGRPSMGKTAFVIKFALSIGVPMVIFSLEMSKLQLAMRMISSRVEISPMVLKSGRFDKSKLQDIDSAIEYLSDNEIYIDDTPALNILQIRSKIKRLVIKYGIKAVFIDYIQLAKGTKNTEKNREREISEISGYLKQIAKECDIPVIALSQLNRMLENRSDKRPQLSDLRESGSLEQDADIVIFVHRPEKYKIEYYDGKEQNPTKNTTELIVAKNRNGAIGDIVVYNNPSMTNISDFPDINPDKHVEPTIFDDMEEERKLPF